MLLNLRFISAVKLGKRSPSQFRRRERRQAERESIPTAESTATIIDGQALLDLPHISRIATQTGKYKVINLPNSSVEQFLLFLRRNCPYVSSVTATPNSDLTSTVTFDVSPTLQVHNPFSLPSHLQTVNPLFEIPTFGPNQVSRITRSADASQINTFSSFTTNSSSVIPSNTHHNNSTVSSNTSHSTRSVQERVSAQETSRSRFYTEQVYQRSSSSYRPLHSRIDSYRPPPRADRYNPYRDHRRRYSRRSSTPPPPPPRSPSQHQSPRPPSPNPLFLLLEGADDDNRSITPSWKRL